MLERLLHGDVPDCFEREGAERPARGGQHDTPHVLAPAGAQRLKDRIVLGIDRQDRRAGGGRPPHEQRAGTDETFLVGKGHRSAALGSGERRLEACCAGDRRHDPIGRPLRGLDDCRRAGGGLDAAAGKRRLEFGVSGRIGDRGKARPEVARETRQRRGVAVRGDRLDAIPARILAQQIDRARPDRAGGAKQRHRTRHGCKLDFVRGFACFIGFTIAASPRPERRFPAARCR